LNEKKKALFTKREAKGNRRENENSINTNYHMGWLLEKSRFGNFSHLLPLKNSQNLIFLEINPKLME